MHMEGDRRRRVGEAQGGAAGRERKPDDHHLETAAGTLCLQSTIPNHSQTVKMRRQK